MNRSVTQKGNSRPWLRCRSFGVNAKDDASTVKRFKLKIQTKSLIKTKLGDHIELPNEGVIRFSLVEDHSIKEILPAGNNSFVHEATAAEVHVTCKATNAGPVAYLNLKKAKNTRCPFLKVTLTFGVKENNNYVANGVAFTWIVDLSLNGKNIDQLHNLHRVVLFASLDNQEGGGVNKEQFVGLNNYEVVATSRVKHPQTTPNAFAKLILSLSWRRERLAVDKAIDERFRSLFWMDIEKVNLPVRYTFRLSAYDDLSELEKYSFQCLWCQTDLGNVDCLAFHYHIYHPEYHIKFFNISNGPLFDICRVLQNDVCRDVKPKITKARKATLPTRGGDRLNSLQQFEFFRWNRNRRDVMISSSTPFVPDVEHFTRCDVSVTDPLSESTYISAKMLSEAVEMKKRVEEENKERGRKYYCGKTGTDELSLLQQEEDSDKDSKHVAWQYQLSAREMSEFVDVADSEKEFMALWNRHRLQYVHINGDCEMANLLTSFVYSYHEVLISNNLLTNFMMHVVHIYQNACIPFNTFRQIIALSQSMMVHGSLLSSLLPKVVTK